MGVSTQATDVQTSEIAVGIEETKEQNVQATFEEGPTKGKRGDRGAKKNGMPRKALKSLIQQEMERQSREVFSKILADYKFAKVESDEASDAQPEIHEGVTCDGCGMSPIVGVRYKCSVIKNFDFCAECEERRDHEHAFLKIKKAGDAPTFMVTVLPEDAPEVKEKTEIKMPNLDEIFKKAFGD